MGEVYLAERDEGTFLQRAALKLIKRGMDSRAIVRGSCASARSSPGWTTPASPACSTAAAPPTAGRSSCWSGWRGCRSPSTADARALGLEERLRLLRRASARRSTAPTAAWWCTATSSRPTSWSPRTAHVKLLDFGIAKLLAGDEDEETAPLTQLDARVLTPAYAAPEQILGEPITTATDVYALGSAALRADHRRAAARARAPVASASLAGAVARETVERPSAVLRRIAAGRRRRASPAASPATSTSSCSPPCTATRRGATASAAALADDLGRFLAGRPIRARADNPPLPAAQVRRPQPPAGGGRGARPGGAPRRAWDWRSGRPTPPGSRRGGPTPRRGGPSA